MAAWVEVLSVCLASDVGEMSCFLVVLNVSYEVKVFCRLSYRTYVMYGVPTYCCIASSGSVGGRYAWID